MKDGSGSPPSRKRTFRTGNTALLLALSMLTLGFAVWTKGEPLFGIRRTFGERVVAHTAGAKSAVRISSSALLRDPHRFVGQAVTVRGEIGEVCAPTLLTIRVRDLAEGGELLIAIPGGRPQSLKLLCSDRGEESGAIEVTGSIRIFVRGVLQHDLGADPGEVLSQKWEGKPILVASSIVTLARNRERSGGKDGVSGGTGEARLDDPAPPTSEDASLDSMSERPVLLWTLLAAWYCTLAWQNNAVKARGGRAPRGCLGLRKVPNGVPISEYNGSTLVFLTSAAVSNTDVSASILQR